MKNAAIFKINDYVTFIDDVMSGRIIQITKDQIIIESEEGFTYKCQSHEIIHRQDLNKLINDDNPITDLKNNTIKKKKSIKRSKKSEVLEVDLHIHHLIVSTKGMSNYELLTIQLNKARQSLKHAIDNNIRRVIFIHGVGEGILKNELIKMLQKYPVEISEASFQKYGLGATEAYIFQNYKHY
jgi:dsDNA-specific endonuclease/ATPase MutS2